MHLFELHDRAHGTEAESYMGQRPVVAWINEKYEGLEP